MKSYQKKALAVLLLAAVVYGAYVCLMVFRAWRAFETEDRVHGTYWPVVGAVYAYAEKHGRPPARLAELLPAFISSIPECEQVERITYSVEADGKEWRLEVLSNALSEARVYCWRSGDTYTDEEKRREVRRYHGSWVVLRVERRRRGGGQWER